MTEQMGISYCLPESAYKGTCFGCKTAFFSHMSSKFLIWKSQCITSIYYTLLKGKAEFILYLHVKTC